MKFVNVILIALMLVAGAAFAGEKEIDNQNALPNAGSRAVLSGTLDDNSATYDRVFGGSVSLECASEVVDSSSDGQHMELFCIQVSDSEAIEIIVDPELTTIGDTVMTLYCDPFDIADPSLNVVSYDDDGGDGLLSAFVVEDGITLTPGNTYFLLIAGYNSTHLGDFSINTSANVIECGTVATDAGSWDSLKADYR